MTYDFVPKGVAHIGVSAPQDVRTIAFVLSPSMSMMAFTSAIEPLRIANQLSQQRLYQWQLLSADGEPVTCSNGVTVQVEGDLSILDPQAYVMLCAGVEPLQNISPKVCDRIRLLWRSGRTVGGLCTGAYGLARAGILKGHDFTLHWENMDPFRELYPDLEPSEALYKRDKRVWTSAGGTSSMDLMVSMIATDYGPELTEGVTAMSIQPYLRDPSERQRPSFSAKFGSRNPHLVKMLAQMEEAIGNGLDLSEVAQELGVSERQLQRQFRKYLNMSPSVYLRQRRLQRARALLGETDLSVTDVAAATGFSSASVLARWFRKEYGQSPHVYSSTYGSRGA